MKHCAVASLCSTMLLIKQGECCRATEQRVNNRCNGLIDSRFTSRTSDPRGARPPSAGQIHGLPVDMSNGMYIQEYKYSLARTCTSTLCMTQNISTVQYLVVVGQ